MYAPYKQVSEKPFKNALIAIDSFHVIRQLNMVIKTIVIIVMNKYKTDKNALKNDTWYSMLKKFSYFFIKNIHDITNQPIRIYKLHAWWNNVVVCYQWMMIYLKRMN